jgi:hypothetical protein
MSRSQRPPVKCQYLYSYAVVSMLECALHRHSARNHTFVCCINNTFHDCSPVHDIVVYRAQLQERFIGIVLVCLKLSHEPLNG